jgi:hypothetical protein
MEARAGLEPAIADLQSAALPLGHRAGSLYPAIYAADACFVREYPGFAVRRRRAWQA